MGPRYGSTDDSPLIFTASPFLCNPLPVGALFHQVEIRFADNLSSGMSERHGNLLH